MSDKVLIMEHITKVFPGVKALDDVSIEAYSGEILSIVGENGAGKSTLMKILSGSYPDDSYHGEIYINQEQVHFKNTKQSEDSGIAMIYQELNMHLDMSVAENLFLGKWERFGKLIAWDRLYDEAQKYLDLINTDVSVREILRNLNASKQQLIAIARALVNNPKLLVLDEPTASLTEAEADKLFSIMHQLKDKGFTCILISHKLDEVFRHSDRIIVMRDGRVINTHSRDQFEQNIIISEMVGRKMDQLYPENRSKIGETILWVENLTVQHPQNAQKNIVENVSFALHKGEILGIGGLVGAGRSELVNAIFGKISKKNGTIYLKSQEIMIKNPRDAIRAGIALVTEDRKSDGFVGGMSIKYNITLASLKEICDCGIIKAKKEESSSRKYYDELRIKSRDMDVNANTLSGGNQQKVVLSKWLMTNPQVLILDEPTRGIDVGTKYEIYKIMVGLAQKGIAIVMISSELPELISMSDRILVLAGGKVSGELLKGEASQEKVMEFATHMIE